MPRYHFHLADGVDYRDEDGVELTDLNAARRMALCYLSDVLRDAAIKPEMPHDWHLEVTSEAGLVLFSVATNVADAPSKTRQVSA
jgi:hypothetical protein